MVDKPSIAVVFHHIGPYHHARLNAAADRLSVTGIEWSAKGYDAWGAPATPARYHTVSLFPEATDHSPGNAELQCAFWSALEQASPDVVAVNGWNNFGSLIAANCCLRRGIPTVVMSESSRQDESRTWWKEAIKRRIAGLYSAALVGGQRHVEYLAELGMPRERIFTGYDVVDNHYFRQKAEEVRSQRSEVRQKYALPENYFLAQRVLSRRRICRGLFRAYAEYRRRSSAFAEATANREVRDRKPDTSRSIRWDLVLLGDGPLRQAINNQLSTLNLNEHVHLPGFKPYEELPGYFAFGERIRACQHERAMGAGRERSHRLGPTRDCVEPLWMCTGTGEWQRVYF